MNLTQEQQELLQQIVDVYDSGCREPFIFSESHSGRFLTRGGRKPSSVPIQGGRTDLKQLEREGLVTLEAIGQTLNGKPTQDGLELGESSEGLML